MHKAVRPRLRVMPYCRSQPPSAREASRQGPEPLLPDEVGALLPRPGPWLAELSRPAVLRQRHQAAVRAPFRHALNVAHLSNWGSEKFSACLVPQHRGPQLLLQRVPHDDLNAAGFVFLRHRLSRGSGRLRGRPKPKTASTASRARSAPLQRVHVQVPDETCRSLHLQEPQQKIRGVPHRPKPLPIRPLLFDRSSCLVESA